MHWRIAPAFVVKSTSFVEVLKEFHVRLTAPEVEICNLKIAPDCEQLVGCRDKGLIKHTMTSVVSESIIVGEEPHPIARSNEVGILFSELCGSMKKL